MPSTSNAEPGFLTRPQLITLIRLAALRRRRVRLRALLGDALDDADGDVVALERAEAAAELAAIEEVLPPACGARYT